MDARNTTCKVIFLDVIETLLDIVPVKEKLASMLYGRSDLADKWFDQMLFYSLVDTLTDSYHTFGEIGAEALRMTAVANRIDLTDLQIRNFIATVNDLKPFEDVIPGLSLLAQAGYRLVTFTNSSNAGIRRQLEFSGIGEFVTAIVSTQDIGYFKPHPHTYRMAMMKQQVLPQESLLIATHAWDICGAKHVGMRTCFLQRAHQELYSLCGAPDYVEASLLEFAQKFISKR